MIAGRTLSFIAALMWTVTWPVALQQVPQIPARDGAQAPQEGSASISGRIVVNDQSAEPVKRVILLLSGGGLVIPRQSTTTDDGRFTFAGLPPGRFTLQAWRSGFVRDMYGNKRPGVGAGSAIVVADGAQVAVTMKLTRAAAISGTVLGLPATVSGLRVTPFQFQNVDGERRLLPSYVGGVSPVAGGAATVDDRGAYRLYGLPPGDYVVATTSFSFAGSADARMMSPEEVRWAQQQFGPRPPGAGPAPDPPVSQPVAYASAYFPGTTDPAAAAVITLGPGEERAGVDFSLPLVSVARVEGSVTDASGQPPQSLQVTLRPTSALMASLAFMSSVRSTPDGKFAATGVMPGPYILTARGAYRTATTADPSAGPPARGGGPPLGPPLWASVELNVDGRDLTNISLSLQPGATVTGRMVYDGAAPAQPVRLRLSLRPQSTLEVFDMAPAAMANADGTFTIAGIAPGRYRFSAAASVPSWSITSAMAGDREWLDETIEIKPADAINNVVVTVTNRPAGLSGKVIDDTGNPTPNFFVVVFSTERRNWASGSRRVAQARPDNTGGFSISILPPGEYYVAALTDLDASQLTESGFLDSLVPASIRVTLVPGEVKVQTLKVAGRF